MKFEVSLTYCDSFEELMRDKTKFTKQLLV
jgi:hypothetical protein